MNALGRMRMSIKLQYYCYVLIAVFGGKVLISDVPNDLLEY